MTGVSGETVTGIMISGRIDDRDVLARLVQAIHDDRMATGNASSDAVMSSVCNRLRTLALDEAFAIRDGGRKAGVVRTVVRYEDGEEDVYEHPKPPPASFGRIVAACEAMGIDHVVEIETPAGPAFRWVDPDSGEIHEVSGTVEAPIMSYEGMVDMALLPVEEARAAVVEWVSKIEQVRRIAATGLMVDERMLDAFQAAFDAKANFTYMPG